MLLLKPKDVAQMLGFSYHYFLSTVQYAKGFPKPVRLTPKSNPKWLPEAIDEWRKSLLKNHDTQ